MFVLEHLWIIPLLPLLGAAINGIFGRRWPRAAINAVALGSTGALVPGRRRSWSANSHASTPSQIPWMHSYFTWIAAGDFRADFALQVDQLTDRHAAGRHRRRLADPSLFHRLHGRRCRLPPLLLPT